MVENQNEIDTLIDKMISGDITPAEEVRLEELLRTHDDIITNERNNAISDGTAQLKPFTGLSREERWAKVQQRTMASDAPVRKFSSFLRYAAVFAGLVIVSVLYLILSPTSKVEFVTARGETRSIILPDSSVVQMNSETTISFDESGWKDERRVSLSGEAFFSVKKSIVPFIVDANVATVRVLGTSFNVRSKGDEAEVICVTGTVGVSAKALGQDAILRRGLGVRVTDAKMSDVYSKDDPDPRWLHGMLKFDQTPIEEVFRELEGRFGKDIEFKSSFRNTTFTGTFEQPEFESILKTICLSAGLSYSVQSDSTIVVR